MYIVLFHHMGEMTLFTRSLITLIPLQSLINLLIIRLRDHAGPRTPSEANWNAIPVQNLGETLIKRVFLL